ncbi:Uncharacterised protein [Klebsiella pneumoniae]|nr:Uncharacterised protein [Klebsiella pneumoniae]
MHFCQTLKAVRHAKQRDLFWAATFSWCNDFIGVLAHDYRRNLTLFILGCQRMVEQAYCVGMAVDIQPPYSTNGHMAYFVP